MIELNLEWAIEFARSYRKDGQPGKAMRRLADALIETRAENKLLRELIEMVRRTDQP